MPWHDSSRHEVTGVTHNCMTASREQVTKYVLRLISKFGKELQALRITIIATIGPIWTENYDILSFFVNEA